MSDPPSTPVAEPPDETRMSFGEHLDELRRRIILALLGLLVAFVVCFNFGNRIIETLTAPYVVAMHETDQDARLIQLDPIESFMEYFKISLEFGLVLAAPWILYQLWLFVATGLYRAERRIVKLFAPASIGLFILGASFMVTVVLSGLLRFLISISAWFPLPGPDNMLYRWLAREPAAPFATSAPAAPPLSVPVLTEDPPSPQDGHVWINRRTRRLNACYEGEVHFVGLQKASSQQFVQAFFSVSEYLGFVVKLALAFGLGFQIPIVVVFLLAMGIFQTEDLRKARKYVVLGVFVLAAILTPSPDVSTMLLLAVPMMLLFEVGLLAGRFVARDAHATAGSA